MSKECTRCKTIKSFTDFGKRSSSKDGLTYVCKACAVKYSAAWKKANPTKLKAQRRRARDNQVVYSSEWTRLNPAKRRAAQAKRRAAKLQRTPSWSDTAEIALIYKQAASLQKLLGMELHVDHIVPLQGKTVSGLHVPHNLQITTATYNLSKSNREEHLNEFQSNDTGRTDGYRNNLCVR